MPKSIFSIIFIFSFCHALTQNLIPNPSFEAYNTCPTSFGQINNLTDWVLVTGHTGSPDFFDVCASSIFCDVPANAFGNQNPATGDGYVGLGLFYNLNPNFREYIQVQFSSPLVAGITYQLSLKVNLADNVSYASPEFSAYFSDTLLAWAAANAEPINTVTPQLNFGTTITNTNDWITISGTFTAAGGEEYMTFGNFKADSNTSINFVGTKPSAIAYYYIDDFLLQEFIPMPLEMLSFSVQKNEDNHAVLNWELANTATNKGNFEIEKSVDGVDFQVIGSISEMEDYFFIDEKPTQGINYYRLKQTDLAGEKQYSHIVSYHFTATTNHIFISPNPIEDIAEIYLENVIEDTYLYITDMTGKVLQKHTIFLGTQLKMRLDLRELPAGVYFLSVPNKKTLKFIKK